MRQSKGVSFSLFFLLFFFLLIIFWRKPGTKEGSAERILVKRRQGEPSVYSGGAQAIQPRLMKFRLYDEVIVDWQCFFGELGERKEASSQKAHLARHLKRRHICIRKSVQDGRQ